MSRGGRFDNGNMKRERRSRSRSPHRGPPRRPGGPGDRDRRGGFGGGANDRMVFISNVSYDVRWMELKNLVREKGGEVNFVELLEDRDGKPKGNAIVEFQTKEGAELCCKNLNKFDLKGRAINAKEIRDPIAFFRKVKEETGIDFLTKTGGGPMSRSRESESERPARTGTYDLFGLSPEFLRQHGIEPPLCDRVFIANLAYNVGTGRMYEIFGLAGKIQWMDLHMDKEGRSKGVCVLQYSHPIEAVQAISMFNGQRLYDRALAVKMDRFEKAEKLPEGALPRGLESIGMGLGADGAPLADVASVVSNLRERTSTPQAALQSQFTSPSAQSYGNSQFTGLGAPYASNSFERMGSAPQSLSTALGLGGGLGQSLGAGMGVGLGGGNGLGQASAFSSGMGNIGGASIGGYGDYKIKKETGYGSSYNVSRVILIKNLPSDYTWQIVRDRVQQFGEIEAVDMLNPGVARIRFVLLQDAERTRTALAGTSVEGRPISVEFV